MDNFPYFTLLKPKDCPNDICTCKQILDMKAWSFISFKKRLDILREKSIHQNKKTVSWWLIINKKKKYSFRPKYILAPLFFIGLSSFSIFESWKKEKKQIKKDKKFDIVFGWYDEGRADGKEEICQNRVPFDVAQKYMPVIAKIEEFKNNNLNKNCYGYQSSLSKIIEDIKNLPNSKKTKKNEN